MLRYAVRLIKLAGTALLVIVLFRSVEWQRVLEALAGIRWTWIALALVAVLTRNVVDALEMRVVLARLGLQIGLWRIFFNNALGNLYALVLPGAVLSKGVKFGAMAAAAGKKSAVLNAMIYNGLIQLFPPLVIGLAALAYDNPLPETRVVEMVVVLGVAITIGLAALYHPTLGRHSLNAMRIVLHRLPERFGKRFSGMVDSIERFQQFRPSDHLLVLTIATLAMVLSLVRLSFGFGLSRGLDLHLSARSATSATDDWEPRGPRRRTDRSVGSIRRASGDRGGIRACALLRPTLAGTGGVDLSIVAYVGAGKAGGCATWLGGGNHRARFAP
jgi:uncharacterized membrane protein YbhN (UPF0104 family)